MTNLGKLFGSIRHLSFVIRHSSFVIRHSSFDMLLWLLFALSVFGLVLSLYMTSIFVRVRKGEEVECIDEVCPIVMKTSYALAFGFPNSYLAVPFYAGLAVFALLRLAGYAAWLFPGVALASFGALAMSVYLAVALLVKLKQN